MMAAYSGNRFPRKIGKNASPISRAAALRCSFCCRMISRRLSDPSRKCSRSPVQMTHSSQLRTSTVQSKRQTPRSRGGRHRSNRDRSLPLTVSMGGETHGQVRDQPGAQGDRGRGMGKMGVQMRGFARAQGPAHEVAGLEQMLERGRPFGLAQMRKRAAHGPGIAPGRGQGGPEILVQKHRQPGQDAFGQIDHLGPDAPHRGMMESSVVVLPAPLAPMSATISPFSTWKEMPCRASMLPYLTRRFSTESSIRLYRLPGRL